MSEERSCEEPFDPYKEGRAVDAAFNAWWRKPYSSTSGDMVDHLKAAFRAGWAARTPTLPAGAHEVVQVDEVTFRVNGHTFRVPRTPLMPIRAAVDRPPAEREETT